MVLQGGSLLRTPGRLISGALSWLSPWKKSDAHSEPLEGEDEVAEVRMSDEDTESTKFRPSMSHYHAEQNRDPSFQAFADMLARKHEVQQNTTDALSVDSSHVVREQNSADTDRQPSRPVNLFAQVSTSHGIQDGSQDHKAGRNGEEVQGLLTPGIVRPRPVHSMDPLKVATTVSRMGGQQRARKRHLAQKFATLVNKHYVYSNERTDLDGYGEPSAFRIAVMRTKPARTSMSSQPDTSYHSNNFSRFSGTSQMMGGLGESSFLNVSSPYIQNKSINANNSTLNSTSMMVMTNNSTDEKALASTFLSESPIGNQSALRSSRISAKEYAERALAPITAALSPSARLLPERANSSFRHPESSSGAKTRSNVTFHTQTIPRIPSAYSTPSFSTNRQGSYGDVGSKRNRESFAPEPSPAPNESHLKDDAGEGRMRPTQRRRLSHQPTQTVKRILEIIKDTSTPASDSSAAWAVEARHSPDTSKKAPADDVNMSDSRSYAKKHSDLSTRNVHAGQSKFNFSEPESIEMVNRPEGRAQSNTKYSFSEPGQEQTDVTNGVSGLSKTGAASASSQSTSASTNVPLSELFKPKPGQWRCA
eukprot:750461-Hanusia_phi.AAC.6